MARSPRRYVGRRWVGSLSIALVLAGFLAIAYVVLKLAPDWFAETENLDPKGKADARQGVRTASLALLAGAIGVVGAVYTARTFGLNRAGQLTDRFSKAIEQLGRSDELDVRLGGIYALERIARDSRDDHPQVVEVLTAYIREHARQPDPAALPYRVPTDVQAVLTVLGRRTLAHEQGAERRLDLDLMHTHLSGARLRGGDLRGAVFWTADLSRATFASANLTAVVFFQADLSDATLRNANLAEANLAEANLAEANLVNADLTGADLSRANLSGADLTETNLTGARYDEHTTWPDGFDPKAAGAKGPA